jgi:hypothetical protein
MAGRGDISGRERGAGLGAAGASRSSPSGSANAGKVKASITRVNIILENEFETRSNGATENNLKIIWRIKCRYS